MSATPEILESIPNVKMVRDRSGNLWLCEASISSEPDSQVCTREEEIIYDRMFGG